MLDLHFSFQVALHMVLHHGYDSQWLILLIMLVIHAIAIMMLQKAIISFQCCCLYMLGVDQKEKSTSASNEKVLMQTSSVCLCWVQWDQNVGTVLGF